jgi:hypothetical protein
MDMSRINPNHMEATSGDNGTGVTFILALMMLGMVV